MPKGVYQRKNQKPVEVKPSNSGLKLREKYKSFICQRDEYLDYNIRGEKTRKLAEIAEVIKALNGSEAFRIPIVDFEKAYGIGKIGRNYVKSTLKKFGIKLPRVEFSADYANMWMPVNTKAV